MKKLLLIPLLFVVNSYAQYDIHNPLTSTYNSKSINDKFDDIALNKQNKLPYGTIIMYGGTTDKAGWFICDGRSLNKQIYKNLFSAIGTTFGSADATHFNIPDFRGMFARGLDSGKGWDSESSRVIGSTQTDTMQGHWHVLYSPSDAVNLKLDYTFAGGTSRGMVGSTGFSDAQADKSANLYPNNLSDGTPRRSSETRPKNIAVNYLIKY